MQGGFRRKHERRLIVTCPEDSLYTTRMSGWATVLGTVPVLSILRSFLHDGPLFRGSCSFCLVIERRRVRDRPAGETAQQLRGKLSGRFGIYEAGTVVATSGRHIRVVP